MSLLCSVRAQLCPTLYDLMDCSLSASSVHGISQARILEWVAFPSIGDLPNTGIQPVSLGFPALAGRFFTIRATWEAHYFFKAWMIKYWLLCIKGMDFRLRQTCIQILP